ncbi:winged helix-turn-helix transcriptional regulator [Bradyrhizobium betae]
MAKAMPARSCPVAAFQKMISGKYKLRIVWDLKDGPRRYGEIEADCSAAPAAARRSLRACSAAS